MRHGIIRWDGPDDEVGTGHPTLLAAIATPPDDPESWITCEGVVLAYAREDCVAWEVTRAALEGGYRLVGGEK